MRCAALLAAHGPMSPKALRGAGAVPNAGSILLRDAYGWFERTSRGVYGLSPQGHLAIERYQDGSEAVPAEVSRPAPRSPA